MKLCESNYTLAVAGTTIEMFNYVSHVQSEKKIITGVIGKLLT